MSRYVVDASVAIKWFVREVHAEAAKRFLAPAHQLLAPDLIWAEFGNVLWKKRRRGEITAAAARGIVADFRRFPVGIWAVEPLIERALEAADLLDRSVYDSLYLALAVGERARLVTADRKLYDAVVAGALGRHVRWVEDGP